MNAITIKYTCLFPVIVLLFWHNDHLKADGLINSKGVMAMADINQAEKHVLKPDHYKIQIQPGAGYLSVGAGYNIRNFYEPTFKFGYMYQKINNNSVKSPVFELKNSLILLGDYMPEYVKFSLGYSFFYTPGIVKYPKLPDYNLRRVYFRDRINTGPFIGLEWKMNIKKPNLLSSGIYIELSTLTPLINDAFQSRLIQFDEIWTITIGFSVYPF